MECVTLDFPWQGKSLCLIGEPGTAKTVMIKNYMETFDKEKYVNRALSFSAETSPALFQVWGRVP